MRWRVLAHDPRFLIGTLTLCLLIMTAVFAPWLAPHDPTETHYKTRFAFPSKSFPLGTDEYGRDILSRLIHGARISLLVSYSSLLIALAGGVALGLIGSYLGGVWETLAMRAVDVILSVPPIMWAIAVVSFLGPGLSNLILVIGLLYIPRFARITYTSSLPIRSADFVESAKAVGCTKFRIILRHIFPNVVSPIIVQASFSLGQMILLESGLSFLGLGVIPPACSWGLMLGTAKGYLYINGLLLLWPAIAIAITILSINLLGDSLRDVLDPTMRRAKH